MKTKQTLFTLLAATVLSAGTASAMPIFSSEDPEVQSVWAFFLPFLNGQTESQKADIQSKLVDLINEQVQNYEDDDYYEDAEFDFATEKPLIIEDLKVDIAEIDDQALKTEATKKLNEIEKITDEEKFFEALDDVYEMLEKHWEDFDDWEEMDFATEKPLIIKELESEIAEIEDATLKSNLTTKLKTLSGLTDEGKFFDALDEIYEKIDVHFGDDDEYPEMIECGFGHGDEDYPLDRDYEDDDDFDFDDEDDWDFDDYDDFRR